MARPRQPVDLVVHKGKAHMTKEQIEQRRAQEIKAPSDAVLPPKTLRTKRQKEKFRAVADALIEIGIMTNLDCDALARYIQSEEKYDRYDKLVDKALAQAKTFEQAAGLVITIEKLEGLRDKAFKQCRAAASDLGLTISSRCKLVTPHKEKQTDPHAGLFGDQDTG